MRWAINSRNETLMTLIKRKGVQVFVICVSVGGILLMTCLLIILGYN